MVRIRYSLTPEDIAELDERRELGFLLRIFRIAAGALLGLIGLAMAWSAIFVFPWHPRGHWFGSLMIAGFGLFTLWMGLDMPGLGRLLRRFSDPCAPREVQIYEGKLVCTAGGKPRQFRWWPQRGFQETAKFFFLRAVDAKVAIPKRAVTPDQESSLRELVQAELAPRVQGDAIDCRFFLTQAELNEASAARKPFLQRWSRTKYGAVLARVFCGAGAYWFLFWFPQQLGTSWAAEFQKEAGVATVLFGFGLLSLYSAAGCPGLKALNRLDLERRVRLSDLEVEVTRGARISTYKWPRFFSYQETQNLFLLRTQAMLQCWTVPKRALRHGDEERLRSLLDRKLPEEEVRGTVCAEDSYRVP